MRKLGNRPVFFAHVPRSGGTSVINWVARHLGERQRYPGGSPAQQLAEKMFPEGLTSLTADDQARIRFYSPHLPVAAHELLGTEVALATLVRDPVDQIRSTLDKQYGGQSGERDLAIRFEESPQHWFVTNQLGWYLGADLDDVGEVFDRIAGCPAERLGEALDESVRDTMAGVSLVERACARLDRMDLVGLAHQRENFLAELARWLGVEPPSPDTRLNRGAGTPLPEELRTTLDALTESDRVIYGHAVALVGAPPTP